MIFLLIEGMIPRIGRFGSNILLQSCCTSLLDASIITPGPFAVPRKTNSSIWHWRQQRKSLWSPPPCTQEDHLDRTRPAPRPTAESFGIVAAMSKNGVIGMDGGIPWRIPQDRRIFKSLTDRGILIVGKRTFEEHPTLAHIDHARCCIVVSSSMATIEPHSEYAPETLLQLARSFPEALMLAGKFREEEELDKSSSSSSSNKKNSSDVTCWVAGGQRLYEEALNHEFASELHLSIVDIEIDSSQEQEAHAIIAMFPPKSLWAAGSRFEETFQKYYPPDGDAPSFNYHVYRSIQ